MGKVEIFVMLLTIIVLVGITFRKLPIPTSLLLVITGMLIGFIPHFPMITLDPKIVLDAFLPLLIYQTSAYSSWRDIKMDFRPIALLSIGHVLFITVLVAIIVHLILPELGWPMAFILGAVISPPDDVAIVSIAEKIQMPKRIVTILKAEGMLNDAPALILFRFSLAALLTHEFSPLKAVSSFFLIVIGETLYGLSLGYILGNLRMNLRDPVLQTMISILTPFLAYLPAEKLGGSGVLATAVVGMYIGNSFYDRFTPDVRLIGRSVWLTLGFIVQSILFLLVGCNLRYILDGISLIPLSNLFYYSSIITVTVILGRFIWVYPATYLPRLLSSSSKKRNPYLPWQYPFIISWTGMRGGISLAAALAVPLLPMSVNGANPRDLLVFLVSCIITATLILQGLALPWMLKILGIRNFGQREAKNELLAGLQARIAMTDAALYWLYKHVGNPQNSHILYEEINLRIREYNAIKDQFQNSIMNIDHPSVLDEKIELKDTVFLSSKLISIERKELGRLWKEGKINQAVKIKLRNYLDVRSKHLSDVL